MAILLPYVLAAALAAVGVWGWFALRRRARRTVPRSRRKPDPAYRTPDPADNAPCPLSNYWAPPPVATADRRGIIRREGNRTAVLMAGHGDRSPQRAYVLNRTSGGLSLAVQQDVPPGITLRLRAVNAPADTPWADVCVRWCEEADGYFVAGCQFRGRLPWNVLLLFG